MKFLSLFILATTLFVSCGKNAVYKPVVTNTPTNTGTGSGVNVGTSYTYLNSVDMEASISYSINYSVDPNGKKEISSNQDSQYNVPVSGVIQIPQLIKVNQGWAGSSNKASIKLEMIGSGTIICTYESIATSTHRLTQTASEGLNYLFKACSDNTVSPLSFVDEVNSVSLTINSADDLFTQSSVLAIIKIFQ